MSEAITAQLFTDRLYEAAVVPEMWPEALVAFTELAGAKASVLIAARGTEFARWIVSSPEFAEIVEAHSQRYSPNIRTARLIAADHAGFVRDCDVLTQQEIDNEPLYQDLLRPNGYGFAVATAIFAPSGDNIIVHAEFASAHGAASVEAIARLDQLRPHLARAALLSSRLGLERAHAMAEALAMLGVPGAVLRGKGRVYAANPLFESLIPGLFQDRRDRLCLTDTDADFLLQQALAALPLASGRSTVSSIPIAAEDERSPMIVHLIPIRGAAHDVFSQATALLVVTPVDRAAVPTAQVLQGLFDLTAAESRLAGLIAQAQTPREAALGLGITEETARTTLKRIFSKTGTRRQAELVRLLSGASLRTPRS
jgi:DNA-binding CsgD family transcriptional regulator